MLVVVGDLLADLVVIGAGALERGTDNPARVQLARGGSAANVAVAAAAASRRPVRFIGRVGDDLLGATLVREIEDAGVEARVQRGGRTGAIVVLVDGEGERTMITDRGAAAELEALDPSWLAGASWLHLPLYGFAEPVSRDALAAAARTTRARGIPSSLDLSSVATMRMLGGAALQEALDAVEPSIVFANEEEAALAAELGLAVGGAFVVKRGAAPVLVTAEGTRLEVEVEPVVAVMDSTGAGDAFAAGCLVATLAGADVASAVRAGNALAATALRRPGALQGLV